MKPAIEIGDAEVVLAFGPENGSQLEDMLPAGQSVTELARRGQRGRAGSKDAESGKSVGGDLQDAAGVGQPVDLVEDDDGGFGLGPEKKLGILEAPRVGGQVAIDVDGIGQHPRQGRLPDPADPGQPDDRALFPSVMDTLQPIGTINHEFIINI